MVTFSDQLWVTDGTPSGTQMLSFTTVPPTFTWGVYSNLYSLGSEAIFAATTVHSNYLYPVTELWASDGTSSGTAPLTVAGEAISGLNPTSITVFGQKAAFLGNDSGGNQGLWITDGTSAGTFELTPSHFCSPPIIQGMMALGSKLLFSAADSSGNQSLWITDGTLAGTTELTIPLPNDGTNTLNNTSLYPQLLATLGNRAIFLGDNANYNTGLWITDGTVAGTTELSTPGLQFPGSNGINPSDFIVLGNKLLFRGTDSVGRVGLWVTDGTSAGTQEITPANADFQGVFSDTSYTPAFVRAGNGVIFQGVDARRGLRVNDAKRPTMTHRTEQTA